MSKEILTNNGLKGGMLKGKAHYDSNGNPIGGIKAIVTDQGGKPIEVEGNEVIINKKSVQSDKVLTVKGTPKEILSTINQLDGNGVAIGNEEAEILAKYRTGGELIKRSGGEIEQMIKDGSIDLKLSESTPEHAEIYGLKAEKPLFVQNLIIDEKLRLKVLEYIDYVAKRNGNDVIFGHINNNNTLTNKSWLHDNGYSVNEDNNDFHKVVIANKYKTGGSIKPDFSKMSKAEIKEFYNSPEGKKLDAETYAEWKRLVNMTKSELEKFYNSEEGKKAGLTPQQASEQGIDSGRESARWIMKMKDIPYTEWSSDMWIWAKKQISFIKRMTGMKGDLYDENGNKTRKHTALLIWGNNPDKDKFAGGGGIESEIEIEIYSVRFDTDDESEIKLVTTSYEDAKREYDGTTIGDFGDSEFNVSLDKKIDKYKFVYELDEDESIEDYPIEEYYEDSYYYELIEEGEFDNIENRVVTAFNSSSEYLLDEVQEWAKDKFGNYKYNTIDVYSEDDTKEENDSIGSIQLRIADHSQNESNLPYGIDRSLSVVIANKDATRGRFQQNRPQIYFDGNDSFDYVISEIENYIEDAKEYIQSKKYEQGGGIEIKNNKNMNKKEIFYAQTSGKKYEIKAYDDLTYETFINGSSNGGGNALDKEDLKYRLDKMIKGSSEIDGINYVIVKDDILENKVYDYTDYESVKSLTKSLIEKYNSEVDSKGKKNKGTKINIEARIDSLYRLVNENPSKYLEDFIDFNNQLPKSFNISSYLIFQKDDYSNNEGIINYLVESKKNPFEFYDIIPYKLPKTKNFKVSPNDSVFMGIHDEFIGNDFLRPIMTGTYFSEKGVVSTNAHILLFTKNRGGEDKFEGVYCHTKKCIDENKDGKIEGKFPNYEAVIPSSEEYSKNINAEYLLTFLKNANKYKMFNSVTHATVFTFETSEGFYKIGTNTQFLASCIEAMIELGHKELSLNFTDPNRAITITPKGKTNSDARYLSTDFALCMPVKIDLFKDIYVFIYDLDTNCSSYEYNSAIYCFDLQKVERENFKKEVKEVKELKEQLKSELSKGTKHEMEHLETLKKVAEREITPEQAVVETAKTHIEENPEYYEDLEKMEKENKETYTYALTLRPFDIGTYPKENFIRLVEEEDNNYRFGLLEYSKPLNDRDIQHYNLAPVSELLKYDGVTFDYFEGNLGKANIKRTEGNIPYVDVDLYDKDTNELVETYDISGEEFLRNIGKDWKIVGEKYENEESIPDLIEGLKILAESLEGSEKKEVEDTIEGLEILLESDDKYAKGGSVDNNTMIFEPSKADQEEEKRIMENQFGKNI